MSPLVCWFIAGASSALNVFHKYWHVFCRYIIWGNAFKMIDEMSTWIHRPVGTTSSNQVLHLTICALPVISDDVQKVKGQQYFCIPGFLPQLKKLVLLSYFSQCIRHALKLYQSCDRDKTFWYVKGIITVKKSFISLCLTASTSKCMATF